MKTEGFEKGVDAKLITEVESLLPLPDVGGGTTRRDSLGDCLDSSAEMIAETNAIGGVQT